MAIVQKTPRRQSETLIQIQDRDGKEMGEALGFHTRRYTEQQLRHAGIPLDRAPWVWTAMRQDALIKPAGLGLALIFLSFSRPRFGLSCAEQDTLELALDGHTDEGIASAMNTSTATIKKRFRAIQEKVEDATIDESAALVREPVKVGVRGPESRRWILNYLRDHQEELRPYYMPASSGAHILQSKWDNARSLRRRRSSIRTLVRDKCRREEVAYVRNVRCLGQHRHNTVLGSYDVAPHVAQHGQMFGIVQKAVCSQRQALVEIRFNGAAQNEVHGPNPRLTLLDTGGAGSLPIP